MSMGGDNGRGLLFDMEVAAPPQKSRMSLRASAAVDFELPQSDMNDVVAAKKLASQIEAPEPEMGLNRETYGATARVEEQ